MKCAVIDLSSTGVSTVISEGDKATGIFEAVYKDRINISVIDYFDGKSISRRGVEKIIDALISARSTCKAMGAEECYVISTAALRNVDNFDEVAQFICQRTGIVVNRLDGETEAYCDLVSNRKYAAFEKAVLIDIGGGSVELCDFSKDSKSEMVCLDLGTHKLRNKYVAEIFPTEDEAKKIKKCVRKKADEAKLPGKNKFATAVLVGTINDAVYAAYREYCEKKKTSTEFTFDKYKKFADMLLTSPERTPLIMKTAPEKINSVPVAVIILKELLKRFKLDNIVVSDCGVKEGYLTLVATGEETGVPVDLSSPVPVPVFVEQDKKPKNKAKKSDGDKTVKKSKGAKSEKSKSAEGVKTDKPKSPATAKASKSGKSKAAAKSGKKTNRTTGKSDHVE